MLKFLLAGTAIAVVTAATAQLSPARAQISGDVVKIGVLNDRSGLYADLGGEGSVAAARIAAEEFGDTINGKKIEIIAADHQNKADIAANIARQWIDQEGVDVIMDVPNSAAALAVAEVTREKKRVFIDSGAATARLTQDACSPTTIHWTYDTYALATGTGSAMVKQGGDTWFFITADYAFGHSLENDTSRIVKAEGGKVLGSVKVPLNTADFSSYLLQAQSSGAKVVGLANAGGDTINSIKQAHEFGLAESGQKLASLLLFLSDVDSLGLEVAKGLILTTGYYWDRDDDSRAWARKFEAKRNAKPTMVHAGVYSGLRHYLQAVKDTGTDDSEKVVARMKATPVNDMFAKDGKILANGRMVHDMYLAEVKTPAESKGRWDYYKILATIPGDKAFQKAEESGCALVKKQ